MNFLFQFLYQKLESPRKLILGLMSGTSADGLNLALCEFKSSNEFQLLQFDNIAYESLFRNKILKIRSQTQVNLEELCRLNVEIAHCHAQIVNQQLQKWNILATDLLAIASHGQTIFHAPAIDFNATLQMGDADHLAIQTGCLVWSDFRQKHIAVGGEGAPLAIYADAVWARSASQNRVLLNLGGIANFTWVPADTTAQVFASDIGPANTLLDTYCKKYFQISFDEDGNLAKQGKLQESLLGALMDHDFFMKKCLNLQDKNFLMKRM